MRGGQRPHFPRGAITALQQNRKVTETSGFRLGDLTPPLFPSSLHGPGQGRRKERPLAFTDGHCPPGTDGAGGLS